MSLTVTVRLCEIILFSFLLAIAAAAYCDSKPDDVNEGHEMERRNLKGHRLYHNHNSGWMEMTTPTRSSASETLEFEDVEKYDKSESEVDDLEESNLIRKKRGMIGLFGLVTKRPQHKTESELLFPPPKDTFISTRGKKSTIHFSRYPSYF